MLLFLFAILYNFTEDFGLNNSLHTMVAVWLSEYLNKSNFQFNILYLGHVLVLIISINTDKLLDSLLIDCNVKIIITLKLK